MLYEFGYGLSYTTFEMSNLDIEPTRPSLMISPLPDAVPIVPGGNPTLWQVLYTVNITVQNTGDIAGATVPQVYLALPQVPGSVLQPRNVLRGFEKIFLQAGETQTVSFPLTRRDLSYWDVNMQEWVIASGAIGVNVGFSSRDIKLADDLVIMQ